MLTRSNFRSCVARGRSWSLVLVRGRPSSLVAARCTQLSTGQNVPEERRFERGHEATPQINIRDNKDKERCGRQNDGTRSAHAQA